VKTDRELLDEAMVALHTIGGAYKARELLPRTKLSLREATLADAALSDAQIEKLALDTWERLATEIATR
jgi:hypothetical protein